MTALRLALLAIVALPSYAQQVAIQERTELASPGPALPAFDLTQSSDRVNASATLYSIGDPTPEEQLHLELINRARANPAAEASRLANITDSQILADYSAAKVDLALMQSQLGTLAVAQPLAMNPRLTAAARLHSEDMFQNVFQEHNGADGTTPFDRLTAAGYFGSAGENIYSNAKSVEHGHAAFEVDWGGPASNGGMQSPPGHREAIHNPIYREVGIGVVIGSKSIPGKKPLDHVGPQLVTEDFGVQQNSKPLITGVAYYDLNGNKFYDIGEGIGNVRVNVAGVATESITARSGGYAVPVTGNGSYTITFSGAGFAPVTRNVSVVGSKNQKVDFVPAYTAPSISGPPMPSIGRDNVYTISAVAGADLYQWRSFQKVTAAPEGAENDLARVAIDQTGSYDVIEGIVVKSGSFAFHLVTPQEAARSQYVTLSPSYLVSANSSLTFQSRFGYALSDQHARVQVSTDDGLTWQTVDNQDGDFEHPQQSWTARSVNLSAFAGKSVRIRFGLEFFGGRYVSSTDLNVGWLFDDIQFANLQEIVGEQITDSTGNSFVFTPPLAADYLLQARARTGHFFLEWGNTFTAQSVPPSGKAELRLNVSFFGSAVQIDGDLVSGASPAKVTLESRGSLGEGWQPESATVEPLSATRFRVTALVGGRSRYYRLRAD